MDESVGVIATLLGGGFAFHRTEQKRLSARRANLLLNQHQIGIAVYRRRQDNRVGFSQFSRRFWLLLFCINFFHFFAWFFPKVVCAVRRLWNATRTFAASGFREVKWLHGFFCSNSHNFFNWEKIWKKLNLLLLVIRKFPFYVVRNKKSNAARWKINLTYDVGYGRNGEGEPPANRLLPAMKK